MSDHLSAHYSDAAAREQALDPSGSFIVQAPAGSGKTGLLVYRILRLLAVSEQPESILAITFTRKATREMRERLLGLLQRADQNEVGENDFDQQGIFLAKAALAQDKRYGWQLLDTPQRIQIQTIDALSLRLVAAMPWLSRLGAQPAASDNADQLYAAAIEQFLVDELLGDEPDPRIQALLTELDFNYRRISKLFSAMLGKRDQWLRHLLSGSLADKRADIEQAWQSLTQTHIQGLCQNLGEDVISRLKPLVSYAHTNLLVEGKLPEALVDKPEPRFSELPSGVAMDEASLVFWRMLSIVLLTGTGTFRKRVDINCGFPPAGKAEKGTLMQIIGELNDDEVLLEQLVELTVLPLEPFSDQDWAQLLDLEFVLKKLAAYLQLQFRAQGKSDHSEVTQRANLALQELDDPTDLSLKLDYQINHILVDEFQDTSFSQIGLLNRLMLGWSSATDQGAKTLFLVGDPMQSIYRFREADVGLFIDVWNNASTRVFAHQTITPLSLSRNFRSSGSLVRWFNDTFSQSFPQLDNSLTGAVRYSAATTHRDDLEPSCVQYSLAADKLQEATIAVQAVQAALAKDDHSSVAVLVRSRGNLTDILPLLKRHNIAYHGLDLAPLSIEPAVIDVLHLTRAIARHDDRIAWLALLRGPWVGISLSDIQTLCGRASESVMAQLQSADLADLETETQQRVERFKSVMQAALAQFQQVDLDVLVRWAWQQLGGAYTLFSLSAASMESVFACIAEHQRGGGLLSLRALEQALEKMYAVPDLAQAKPPRLTISTIHKSKGLEFDTVILPGLGNVGRSDDKDLLMWAEWQARAQGERLESQLLLAPLSLAQKKLHYEYLRHLESKRAANERGRLLYVATTRAAKSLVLIACLKSDEESGELKVPPKTALLHELWPVHEVQFERVESTTVALESGSDPEVIKPANNLTRLPIGFRVAVQNDTLWRSSLPSLMRAVTQDSQTPSEQDT